jgi:hypothetical protein
MTLRSIVAAAGIVILGASLALAQTKPAPTPATPNSAQATAKPAAPQPPRPEGPLQNVRIEITITDQRLGAAAVKKTISVVAADGLLNRIRSSSSFAGQIGEVPLNVDVTPLVRTGGKIRVSLTLQYDLPSPQLTGAAERPTGGVALIRTQISETLNTVLDDGKPLVIAQSADPISDRQVTIEVMATILK